MGTSAGSNSLCARATRKTGCELSQRRSNGETPTEPNNMTKICDINLAAKEKLPPAAIDKSGIGVHYTDAFLKPMNTKLPDGTRVSCKRKGLKIMLVIGMKKGEGLMRRIDVSKDPVVMLAATLQEAAKGAGIELKVTDKEIFVDGLAASPAA